MIPGISVHRSTDRFRTNTAGVSSSHSFSFGSHHDPLNTHHGLLIAHNEDVLAPGAGFEPHPHRDMEIVTWVLSGALAHSDSASRVGLLGPGSVQRMSAGSGVTHSERNAVTEPGAPGAAPVHYLQMWIVPSDRGTEPTYARADVDLSAGELVPIASGLPKHARSTAVGLGNSAAGLSVANLRLGESIYLPASPYLHMFVASGQVELEDAAALAAGDAARLTDAGARRVQALETAQILVWEMLGTAFT